MKKQSLLAAATLGLALSANCALAETTIKMVEVISSPPRTAFLKTQIAEFEAANPGVKVELTSLTWGEGFQKLLTMVQAGDTPDIAEIPDFWLALYANNGQLEDLGPYVDKWKDGATLGARAKEFGSSAGGKLFMVPYGYYLEAMFWNKKLFSEAGLTTPPKTLDEMMDDNQKISALPGKYGLCLRGGSGASNDIVMYMNIANGKGDYFNKDGTSTLNEPGAVNGLQMLADIYQKGYAPKDSVTWGGNETVAGFYSGTCAMLPQSQDVLGDISAKMKAEDYGIAPLPTGPSGKSYPTLGYVGWSMFSASKAKDETWKLMASLLSPAGNMAWAKNAGVLPIHDGADKDPYFSSDTYKAWFEEINAPDTYEFVSPPGHLENLSKFREVDMMKNFQEVLLAQRTAKDVADEWAAFMTKEQQTYLAAHK